MKQLDTQHILKKIGEIADRKNILVWAVGGFIRDRILDVNVKDIDFAVEGSGPDFAKSVANELGTKSIVIFERFGTAMVNYQDFKLEFVGTRQENYEKNSRRPFVVESTLDEDLLRRDFTINTIAFGINGKNFGKIYDPLHGRKDIKRKLIRTPLDPTLTFKDDPLRIMRAVRFAAQLGFKIEEATFSALTAMNYRLEIISQERITDEFLKILDAPRPSIGFDLLEKAGVIDIILPEIAAMNGMEQRVGYHHKDVWKHTLAVVDNIAAVSDRRDLRFTALVHDIGKPATRKFEKDIGWTFHGHDEIGARILERVCRRLKLTTQLSKFAQKLTRLHLRPIHLTEEGVTDSAIRRLLVQAGDDLEDVLTLCRADITSQNPKRVKKHLANFDFLVQRIHEIEEKDRMRKFQSPVRGEKIMEVCGIKPGPQVGKIKKILEEAILDGKIPNEYEAALAYLMEIKNEVSAQSGSL